MEYISEAYINIVLKKELDRKAVVNERAAKFMVGDIRNEDKEDLSNFHRRYAPSSP